MKRELCAVLLLAVIFAASIWNIHYFDRMTEDLLSELDRSAAAAESGDCETAAALLTDTLDRWDSLDLYSGITLRHAETDSCTDLFYALLGELYQGNTGKAKGLYQNLQEHLRSLAEMEHPTLKSVF